MTPKISTKRRNTLHFLSLFNIITGPIIGILFVVFILLDIPLKHLVGFIALYAITKTLSLLFDSHEQQEKRKDLSNKTVSISLLGVNIISLLFLTLLIKRYELSLYQFPIYSIALVSINILFLEFTYHLFAQLMKTQLGNWIFRTSLLIICIGVGIYGINTIRLSPTPTVPSIPQKTSSEVTGVISTVDPYTTEQTEKTSSGNEEQQWSWNSLQRGLWIGDTGKDITDIQTFLTANRYFNGDITGVFDKKTAMAVNTYLKDKTGDTYYKLELGEIKLRALQTKEEAIVTPPTKVSQGSEATGTIDTIPKKDNITVESITSLDGKATATIKDGKIIVQVIDPKTLPSKTENNTGATITDGWKIHSSIQRAVAGGGLQGVVISAPISLPTAGTHASYQSIILTADGASGIFFTTDGSDPSCDGKGSTDTITDKKSFTLKAISCFGGNRVRGPIASYAYTLGK